MVSGQRKLDFGLVELPGLGLVRPGMHQVGVGHQGWADARGLEVNPRRESVCEGRRDCRETGTERGRNRREAVAGGIAASPKACQARVGQRWMASR